MTSRTALAILQQHSGIDADLRARSLTATIKLIEHWVAESQHMLPEDKGCDLYAMAAKHQVKIVQSILIGIGAEFDTVPGPLSRMRLLDIDVLSDQLNLEIFTAWAEAAKIALARLHPTKNNKDAA